MGIKRPETLLLLLFHQYRSKYASVEAASNQIVLKLTSENGLELSEGLLVDLLALGILSKTLWLKLKFISCLDFIL